MTATMTLNQALNGIEISFEKIPSTETRDTLKANGFRWHRIKKVWYAKQTSERLDLAKNLTGGEIAEARQTHTTDRHTEVKNKFGLKVGDILTDSWGYNMTIVEFYKVTKILSPCKVEIVELHKNIVDGSIYSPGGAKVLPDVDNYADDPIQKITTECRWSRAEVKAKIKINSSVTLTPWDGSAKYECHWD